MESWGLFVVRERKRKKGEDEEEGNEEDEARREGGKRLDFLLLTSESLCRMLKGEIEAISLRLSWMHMEAI